MFDPDLQATKVVTFAVMRELLAEIFPDPAARTAFIERVHSAIDVAEYNDLHGNPNAEKTHAIRARAEAHLSYLSHT